jgi:hypothetical protein
VASTIAGVLWSSHPKFATFCKAEYVVSACALQGQLARQTTTLKTARTFFIEKCTISFEQTKVQQGGISEGKPPSNPAPMAQTGATHRAAR